MKTNKKAEAIPISRLRKDGVWLSPERAAPYFRNGRGIALGSLMNNLRSGKLQHVSIRDEYGWLVFVPQLWIDAKMGKVIPFHPNNTTQKTA